MWEPLEGSHRVQADFDDNFESKFYTVKSGTISERGHFLGGDGRVTSF